MKTIILVFTLSFCFTVCKASDINLDGQTIQTDAGEACYLFSIPTARFDSQPVWKPGKQAVPLTIDKALQITQAWIKKQPWSKKFEGFDEITLKSQDGCWFYEIDIDFPDQAQSLRLNQVVILLDGSIVEPKKVKSLDRMIWGKPNNQ